MTRYSILSVYFVAYMIGRTRSSSLVPAQRHLAPTPRKETLMFWDHPTTVVGGLALVMAAFLLFGMFVGRILRRARERAAREAQEGWDFLAWSNQVANHPDVTPDTARKPDNPTNR